MNELIKIESKEIDKVYRMESFTFGQALELIKQSKRIRDYGFLENQDFLIVTEKSNDDRYRRKSFPA